MSVCKKALGVAFLLVFTAACGHMKPKVDPANPAAGAATGTNPDDAPRAQIRETEDASETVETKLSEPYKSPLGEIAMDYNPMVEKWINYFQGKGRGYMTRYLERSGRYLPMMKNVLRENGLPEDLVYIALIESGFTHQAHSHANAVGYWQFIKSTGRRYGLNVDPFIDERRDPVLSTRAAAEYFKSLYSLFGNWHLAMAAYNVGENRVKRAVMKYYTRDFWELTKKRRSFPVETKNYIPKYIAAAMIAKDPAKYGFTDIAYADPLSYDTITLQNPISFNKLAANLNVDAEELRLLNPKFRGDFVPLSRGGETVVRIPVGMAADAQAAASVSASAQPKIVMADYYYYRIRRGDSLSTIARRHRTTVSRLRRENNLSNRALLRVGQKLRVPDGGGHAVAVADDPDAQVTRTSMQVQPTGDTEFHIVRRGDNLSTIARRYGIAIAELLRLNSLTEKTVLRVGQRLRLKGNDPNKNAVRGNSAKRKIRPLALAQFKSSATKTAGTKKQSKARHMAAAVEAVETRRHIVRRGETLAAVSKKYGVRLQKLAKANGVSINYRVLAGEALSIP